jgi:hypothetical protein
MNCLYISLFFNIVVSIVQTFIESWNQLLYPRVIDVCRMFFESRHEFFLHVVIPEESKTTIRKAVTEKIGHRKLRARRVPKI